MSLLTGAAAWQQARLDAKLEILKAQKELNANPSYSSNPNATAATATSTPRFSWESASDSTKGLIVGGGLLAAFLVWKLLK